MGGSKKKNKENNYSVKFTIVLFLGLLMDFLVKTKTIPFWPVEREYIYSIFTAITTVGTLGSTILSIVISSSNASYLCFSLREICRMKRSPFRIESLLLFSIGPAILGILCLCFKLHNTMAALLIWTGYIIFQSSKTIWDLTSDSSLVQSIIEKEIERMAITNSMNLIGGKISDLRKGLIDAIRVENANMQDEYFKIIQSIFSNISQHNEFLFLSEIISIYKSAFPLAVEYSGFSTAYNKILSNAEAKAFKDDVFKSYMNDIQNFDNIQMCKFNISKKMQDIINNLKEDQGTVGNILLWLYSSIVNNYVIDEKLKKTLFKEFFEELCDINDFSQNATEQSLALQYCFKEAVLTNANAEQQKEIYNIIIDCLYRNNTFASNEIAINTAAELFRAIFFFSEYETETLEQEHRKKIRNLLDLNCETIDKMTISFSKLIQENIKQMLNFYIQDAIKNNMGGIFDYFPAGFGCKSMTWTKRNRIHFAFFFYLLEWYTYTLFPISTYLDEHPGENKEEIKNKRMLCLYILELFDSGNEILLEGYTSRIETLQSYLKMHNEINENNLKANFNYFNEKYKQFNTIIERTPILPENEQILEKLQSHMNENLQFINDPTLPLDDVAEYQLKPQFCQSYYGKDSEARVAKIIYSLIIKVINKQIFDTLSPITLTFNQEGVNNLLGKLASQDYGGRNYTFVDDYALGNEIRESQEYKKLLKKIEAIPVIENKEIRHRVFLQNNKISLNYELLSYTLRKPNHEETEIYLQSCKVADGKFKLEYATYTKEEAIKWVAQHIKVEFAVVKATTDITAESGFRIDFSYNK